MNNNLGFRFTHEENCEIDKAIVSTATHFGILPEQVKQPMAPNPPKGRAKKAKPLPDDKHPRYAFSVLSPDFRHEASVYDASRVIGLATTTVRSYASRYGVQLKRKTFAYNTHLTVLNLSEFINKVRPALKGKCEKALKQFFCRYDTA